jgi:hypothetical protein
MNDIRTHLISLKMNLITFGGEMMLNVDLDGYRVQ